jgi:hypothetical protein
MIKTIIHEPHHPFHDWRRNVYSQSGEDGILEQLFKRIQVDKGYFVEFGAWDGRHLSNSAKLAEEGWRGCFIEGNPERFQDLEKNYKDSEAVKRLNVFVDSTGVNSLDNLLQRINAPKVFDLLSIDIDGNDYHVWASLQDYRPRLVVVEFNPTIPTSILYVQENEPWLNRGASLAALAELAKKKDYALVAATEWNAFFMDREVVEQFAVATYQPQEVKGNQHEAFIFHGYDGTLIIAGQRKLLWHGIEFSEDELQILPQSLRKIPIAQSVAFFDQLRRFIQARKKDA